MFVCTRNKGSCFLPCPLPRKGFFPERIAPFIPGFRLEEFCGKGGSSSVWKGKDLKGEPFAIRIVYKKGNVNWRKDQASHLLYREKIPVCQNLLPLLYCGERREFSYFVTPLADNLFPGGKYVADTLSNRLKYPALFPFSPEEIFFLMGELLNAVEHLHKNGLAHNDLKPENILFIKKRPSLTDFGLAAPLSQKNRGGTREYRPPWQDAAGSECDIFALGKILYTLFTGKDASFYPLLPEELPVSDELGAFFNSLISGMCSPEKEKRFSSAANLKELFREGEKIFLL